MIKWQIRPFSKDLDRSGFDCGVEALNAYLQSQAGQDIKRRVCAVQVAVDEDEDERRIGGYYTLSAASVGLNRLPVEVTRKLPRYPDVPAFLIGRLAVSRATQGTGLGRVLLIDALIKCLDLSDEVGAALVVVDAKDEKAAEFYRRHQFADLVENRLFLPLSVVAQLR